MLDWMIKERVSNSKYISLDINLLKSNSFYSIAKLGECDPTRIDVHCKWKPGMRRICDPDIKNQIVKSCIYKPMHESNISKWSICLKYFFSNHFYIATMYEKEENSTRPMTTRTRTRQSRSSGNQPLKRIIISIVYSLYFQIDF